MSPATIMHKYASAAVQAFQNPFSLFRLARIRALAIKNNRMAANEIHIFISPGDTESSSSGLVRHLRSVHYSTIFLTQHAVFYMIVTWDLKNKKAEAKGHLSSAQTKYIPFIPALDLIEMVQDHLMRKTRGSHHQNAYFDWNIFARVEKSIGISLLVIAFTSLSSFSLDTGTPARCETCQINRRTVCSLLKSAFFTESASSKMSCFLTFVFFSRSSKKLLFRSNCGILLHGCLHIVALLPRSGNIRVPGACETVLHGYVHSVALIPIKATPETFESHRLKGQSVHCGVDIKQTPKTERNNVQVSFHHMVCIRRRFVRLFLKEDAIRTNRRPHPYVNGSSSFPPLHVNFVFQTELYKAYG